MPSLLTARQRAQQVLHCAGCGGRRLPRWVQLTSCFTFVLLPGGQCCLVPMQGLRHRAADEKAAARLLAVGFSTRWCRDSTAWSAASRCKPAGAHLIFDSHPPPPGLLRVISWTLNGLDVCTQNAVVRTSEDGQAHNTFWLTKRGTGGLD